MDSWWFHFFFLRVATNFGSNSPKNEKHNPFKWEEENVTCGSLCVEVTQSRIPLYKGLGKQWFECDISRRQCTATGPSFSCVLHDILHTKVWRQRERRGWKTGSFCPCGKERKKKKNQIWMHLNDICRSFVSQRFLPPFSFMELLSVPFSFSCQPPKCALLYCWKGRPIWLPAFAFFFLKFSQIFFFHYRPADRYVMIHVIRTGRRGKSFLFYFFFCSF